MISIVGLITVRRLGCRNCEVYIAASKATGTANSMA